MAGLSYTVPSMVFFHLIRDNIFTILSLQFLSLSSLSYCEIAYNIQKKCLLEKPQN